MIVSNTHGLSSDMSSPGAWSFRNFSNDKDRWKTPYSSIFSISEEDIDLVSSPYVESPLTALHSPKDFQTSPLEMSGTSRIS